MTTITMYQAENGDRFEKKTEALAEDLRCAAEEIKEATKVYLYSPRSPVDEIEFQCVQKINQYLQMLSYYLGSVAEENESMEVKK